jgi:hypothetical protein
VYSILYRLHAFADLDVTLLGLAAVDVATVGVVVSAVRASTPKNLRRLCQLAFAAAVAAALPFVGAVVAMGHHAFLELARGEWRSQVFDAHLARHVVCGYIILLLGVGAALAPALAAALSARRSKLVTEHRDLEARRLQRWATLSAAPIALQLAWATVWLLTDELAYELYGLFHPEPGDERKFVEGLVAMAILLATSLAAIAAVALPFRAAARASSATPLAFSEPTRFFTTEQP